MSVERKRGRDEGEGKGAQMTVTVWGGKNTIYRANGEKKGRKRWEKPHLTFPNRKKRGNRGRNCLPMKKDKLEPLSKREEGEKTQMTFLLNDKKKKKKNRSREYDYNHSRLRGKKTCKLNREVKKRGPSLTH